VCSFSNITSLRNRSLLFVKHFNSSYPHKDVPNKATIHRLVTKFRDTGSVYPWQIFIQWRNVRNYGFTDFKQCVSYKNEIWPQEFDIAIDFVAVCVKVFMCIVVTVAFKMERPIYSPRYGSLEVFHGAEKSSFLPLLQYSSSGDKVVVTTWSYITLFLHGLVCLMHVPVSKSSFQSLGFSFIFIRHVYNQCCDRSPFSPV
jgi:hypothetical protein